MSRILASLLAFATSAAAAEDPRPEDFAYSIPIEPTVEAALYRVRLPLTVYRSVSRTDLGDLRIFNAAGALVPHELWMPDDEKIERRTAPVRVFPLLEATPEELSFIRVQIESGAESTSVTVAPDGSDARAVLAYLIELAELIDQGPVEPPLPGERLVLYWNEPAEGFVRELQLEESDDLATFRSSTSAVVADLRRGGERLLRNDIPLPAKLPRYLRIASRGEPLPMVLHRVDLVLSSRVQETAWLEVEALRHEEDGLHFETPGPVLVREIEVLPRERNTWTEVQLFSRPERKAPWVLRAREAIYRFQVGADTRVDVGSTRDRFWRLSTDEARGGFGADAPALRVGSAR